MDLHADLRGWRVAQKRLADEAVLARENDRIYAPSRRIHALVEQSNAIQRGRVPVTGAMTTFFKSDDRLMVQTAQDREQPMAKEMSGSNGILDMYGWHEGKGVDQLERTIAIQSGISQKYKNVFAKAPQIVPYMGELIDPPESDLPIERALRDLKANKSPWMKRPGDDGTYYDDRDGGAERVEGANAGAAGAEPPGQPPAGANLDPNGFGAAAAIAQLNGAIGSAVNVLRPEQQQQARNTALEASAGLTTKEGANAAVQAVDAMVQQHNAEDDDHERPGLHNVVERRLDAWGFLTGVAGTIGRAAGRVGQAAYDLGGALIDESIQFGKDLDGEFEGQAEDVEVRNGPPPPGPGPGGVAAAATIKVGDTSAAVANEELQEEIAARKQVQQDGLRRRGETARQRLERSAREPPLTAGAAAEANPVAAAKTAARAAARAPEPTAAARPEGLVAAAAKPAAAAAAKPAAAARPAAAAAQPAPSALLPRAAAADLESLARDRSALQLRRFEDLHRWYGHYRDQIIARDFDGATLQDLVADGRWAQNRPAIDGRAMDAARVAPSVTAFDRQIALLNARIGQVGRNQAPAPTPAPVAPVPAPAPVVASSARPSADVQQLIDRRLNVLMRRVIENRDTIIEREFGDGVTYDELYKNGQWARVEAKITNEALAAGIEDPSVTAFDREIHRLLGNTQGAPRHRPRGEAPAGAFNYKEAANQLDVAAAARPIATAAPPARAARRAKAPVTSARAVIAAAAASREAAPDAPRAEPVPTLATARQEAETSAREVAQAAQQADADAEEEVDAEAPVPAVVSRLAGKKGPPAGPPRASSRLTGMPSEEAEYARLLETPLGHVLAPRNENILRIRELFARTNGGQELIGADEDIFNEKGGLKRDSERAWWSAHVHGNAGQYTGSRGGVQNQGYPTVTPARRNDFLRMMRNLDLIRNTAAVKAALARGQRPPRPAVTHGGGKPHDDAHGAGKRKRSISPSGSDIEEEKGEVVVKKKRKGRWPKGSKEAAEAMARIRALRKK